MCHAETVHHQPWASEFGADEGLTRAVSRLRRALREAGDGDDDIETIPKRGYRLVVDVSPLSETGTGPARSPARPARHKALIFVLMCTSLAALAQESSGSDDFATQRDALSETLEQPLRTHLVKKGYTPRNAARVADNLLDMYAQCLASMPRTDLNSEPEVTIFPLGETSVLAYKSLCLTGFIDDVASIA